MLLLICENQLPLLVTLMEGKKSRKLQNTIFEKEKIAPEALMHSGPAILSLDVLT